MKLPRSIWRVLPWAGVVLLLPWAGIGIASREYFWARWGAPLLTEEVIVAEPVLLEPTPPAPVIIPVEVDQEYTFDTHNADSAATVLLMSKIFSAMPHEPEIKVALLPGAPDRMYVIMSYTDSNGVYRVVKIVILVPWGPGQDPAEFAQAMAQ